MNNLALFSTRERFPIRIPLADLTDYFDPFGDHEDIDDTPTACLMASIRMEAGYAAAQVEDVQLGPVLFEALVAATERHVRRHSVKYAAELPGPHPRELSEKEIADTMFWWRAGTVMEASAEVSIPAGMVCLRAPDDLSTTRTEEHASKALAEILGKDPGPELPRPPAASPPAAAAPTSTSMETEALVYLVSSGRYYARNGLSIDLRNPMDEQAARKFLVGALRFDPKRARRTLENMLLPCAQTVGCDPDQGPIFTDADGRTALNTYVPSDIEPVEGPCPVLDEVLGYVTNDDAAAKAWLTNWLAFAYQHPTTTMRTAPVLCGSQRTGKSLLANAMRRVMGDENCVAIRNKDMTSGFTAHFANRLLVVITEAEASDVRHARSMAKYFTGESRILCEGKGVNPHEIRNRMKWMATSNETLPVFVERNDTRWAVFRNDRPAPEPYIRRMGSLFGFDNDLSPAGLAELRAFAHFLKTYPVDAELAGNVFKGEAREEAIALGAGSVESFTDALDDGLENVVRECADDFEAGRLLTDLLVSGHPNAAESGALYRLYRLFCSREGHRYPAGKRLFMADLLRARPEWSRHTNERGRGDNRLRVIIEGRVQKVSAVVGIPRAGATP